MELTRQNVVDIAVVLVELKEVAHRRQREAPRPRMFIATDTEQEARQLREVFGDVGYVTPKHSAGYRWGCFGSDCLVVLRELLDAGLSGRAGRSRSACSSGEYPEHMSPRTPGAFRLHGPQNNTAHALPSDTPRGRDGGWGRWKHTRTSRPGKKPQWRVRALEAKRTDYLSRRQPVERRLTGDIAEYGCQAEEYGVRGNRMPNPKR